MTGEIAIQMFSNAHACSRVSPHPCWLQTASCAVCVLISVARNNVNLLCERIGLVGPTQGTLREFCIMGLNSWLQSHRVVVAK